jgi:hypothetical protein
MGGGDEAHQGSDDSVDRVTLEKGFTYAWRVTGLEGARVAKIIGWARSEPLAKEAAGSHALSAAKSWTNVKAEVVEVETLP